MGITKCFLGKVVSGSHWPDFLIGIFSVQIAQLCDSIAELYYEFLVSKMKYVIVDHMGIVVKSTITIITTYQGLNV